MYVIKAVDYDFPLFYKLIVQKFVRKDNLKNIAYDFVIFKNLFFFYTFIMKKFKSGSTENNFVFFKFIFYTLMIRKLTYKIFNKLFKPPISKL